MRTMSCCPASLWMPTAASRKTRTRCAGCSVLPYNLVQGFSRAVVENQRDEMCHTAPFRHVL